MTLHDLFTELANKGLRIRILSERQVRVYDHLPEPTKWQWTCQLLHPNGFVDSENGDTAFVAISNAMERASGNRGPDNRPHNTPVIVHRPVVKETPAKPDDEIEYDFDDIAPKKHEEYDFDDLI